MIFALTVLPHEQALLRRGRRLVGSEADARDLVQETLERALRTFHGFRPGTAVWAWLRTIMNSVWIDGWRRRQVAAKICSLPTIDMAGPDPEPNASERRDEEILARLPEAISRLTPIFRQVLELRLQENRSYGEIAERLGIPARTVGTRILRARRQLRAILEEEIAEAAAPAAHQRVLPFARHSVTLLRPRKARKTAAPALAPGRDPAPGAFVQRARAAAQ
ncbi:MAG TPA: RNA polymerase sigma factor [Polyangia bacterium]|nr:RNA polymerase sigma factor [Polyangia bacterium]